MLGLAELCLRIMHEACSQQLRSHASAHGRTQIPCVKPSRNDGYAELQPLATSAALLTR